MMIITVVRWVVGGLKGYLGSSANLSSIRNAAKQRYLFICLPILWGVNGSAIAQTFSSQAEQSIMIELYTSQGCHSCPPAEKYLNDYKNHPQLWKRYIPIAFHVDYWDYLGWKDRFAAPEHTLRQRNYAKVNRQRAIYTPAFFVNGKPWRRGLFSAKLDSNSTTVGSLVVKLTKQDLTAQFSPTKPEQAYQLYVAVLGMDLATDIKAGENTGRHSRHEFVVLHHQVMTSQNLQWQMQVPAWSKYETDKLSLVAWLSLPDDPRPIQAVGGFIQP